MSDLDPTALSHLYRWIDTIPLDRPKRNIARDFSDGVLMSQVVHYFFPRIVELHNYSASNSIDQKNYNWKTLNQKVFKKMGFMISPLDIEAVVGCKKHAIERILLLMQTKIGEYQQVVAQENAAATGIPQQQQDSPTAAAAPAQQRRQQPQHHEEAKMQSPPAQQQAAQPARKKQQGAPDQRAAPQRDQQGRGNMEQQQDRATAPPARAAAAGQAASSSSGGGGGSALDSTVHDLRETIDILQLKVQKLEQLLRLKNSKIASLQQKLEAATGVPQQ